MFSVLHTHFTLHISYIRTLYTWNMNINECIHEHPTCTHITTWNGSSLQNFENNNVQCASCVWVCVYVCLFVLRLPLCQPNGATTRGFCCAHALRHLEHTGFFFVAFFSLPFVLSFLHTCIWNNNMALADVGGVTVVRTAILWGKHDMQSTCSARIILRRKSVWLVSEHGERLGIICTLLLFAIHVHSAYMYCIQSNILQTNYKTS